MHPWRPGFRPKGEGDRDALERPYTVGGGGVPPPPDPPHPPLDPPPPLLPFQCFRVTATILLRRLRCHEDLRFTIFGPPSVGTIGGPKEEGVPAKPPLQTPPPPF